MSDSTYFYKPIYFGWVVVLGASLAACGGGGGDAGGTSAPTPSVQLTTQNAEAVATEAVTGSDDIFGLPAMNVLRSASAGQQDGVSLREMRKFILNKAESNGLATLARSTRATESEECSGGGSVSVTGSETSGTIIFNSCVESGVTITGSATFSYTGSGDLDFYINDYHEEGTLSFNNISAVYSGNGSSVSIVMNGTLNYVETYTAATARTVGTDTIPSFTVTGGGESFAIYNVVSEWTDSPVSETWNERGTFSDSIGVYSFETLVTFEHNYGNYPHAGQVKISGLNSSVTVTIESASLVKIELDADGDGTVDETWTEHPSAVGLSSY